MSRTQAQDALKDLYAAQKAEYEQYLAPQIEAARAKIASNATVRAAEQQASGLDQRTQAQVARMRGRSQVGDGTYGGGARRARVLDAGISARTALVNDARVQQAADRSRLRGMVLGHADQLESAASSSLGQIAQMEQQREAAYQQAKAKSKSSFGSLLGGIAGAAIGTAFGMPTVGAAMGAGIGGSV